MDVSVIVTTFERPRHLARSLEGLLRQTEAGRFEVIVADDGSTDETADVVEEYRDRFDPPLKSVRQEHEGYRLARLRNLGAREAITSRFVFLDGDCVPGDRFVAAHRAAGRRGDFAVGARHNLDAKQTEAVTPESIRARGGRGLIGRAGRRHLWLRAVSNRVYSITGLKDRPKIIGANFGVSRELWLRVNGFDERYVGWGYEDEDFARRLRSVGARKIDVTATARVAHLWHPAVPSFSGRARDSQNRVRFDRGPVLARCRRGYDAIPLREVALQTSIAPLAERFPRGRIDPPEVILYAAGESSTRPLAGIPCGVALLRGESAPDASFVVRVEATSWSDPNAVSSALRQLDAIL